MLSEHVAVARRSMDPPWDGAREARVLARTTSRRQAPRRERSFGRVLVLGVASLASWFVVQRTGLFGGDRGGSEVPASPSPAALGGHADALDGGKQSG